MINSRETNDSQVNESNEKNKQKMSLNKERPNNNENIREADQKQIFNVNIIKNTLKQVQVPIQNLSETTQSNSVRKLSSNTDNRSPYRKFFAPNENNDDFGISSEFNESDNKPLPSNNIKETIKGECRDYKQISSSQKHNSNNNYLPLNKCFDAVNYHVDTNYDSNYTNVHAEAEYDGLKEDDVRTRGQEAINYKRLGNDLLNKKDYNKAIEYYKKALFALNLNSNYKGLFSQSNINSIKIDCLNNMSICFFLKKDFEKVLESTQQVRINIYINFFIIVFQALIIHKNNYKCLFIRSRALKQLSRWEEALEVIKMVN